MAAGAGGDHAAECRQLHALGEVAHGEAVAFQLRFHRRHADAALDARGAAGLVDLENPVEAGQVEADGAVVAATDRGLDSTADRGAAAERDDRDVGAGGIVVDRLDIRLRTGEGDEVGGGAEIAFEDAGIVGEGFAVGVNQAVALAGAGEGRQGGGDLQARCMQLDRLFARRLADFEITFETFGEAGGDHLVFFGRYLIALVAPADNFQLLLCHRPTPVGPSDPALRLWHGMACASRYA